MNERQQNQWVFYQVNLIMWMTRRTVQKQVQGPSENVQPLSRNSGLRDNQLENGFNQNVQIIAQSILKYQPVSQILSVESISGSCYTQVRKYKETVYWGEIRQGKRNGLGIMLYVNGRVYEGYWENNYKNGKGYEKFTNASIYKGDYVQGKPEGCGRYEWANGQVYEGEWKNGLKNGSGIWRGSKGDSYIGEWRDGKAQGYGVHTWINGDRYQGEFKDCLKHGEGVQRFANGDTYKGMYEVGKPSGYGEYYWATGSFFKGQFKSGLRCGQGMWKRGPGRSDKYEGDWVSDKKQGFGVFTWAQGNVYKGNYVNDLREGYGEMFQIDGTVSKGNWKGDQLIEVEVNSIMHDEDCELLIPSTKLQEQNDGLLDLDLQRFYLQDQGLNEPVKLYNNGPQRPGFLKSAERQFRRHNMTKQSFRNNEGSKMDIQSSRGRSLNKKMSVGTVSGKMNPYKQQKKSLSSSFFLYKINGGIDGAGSRELNHRRQIRTSGVGRNGNAQVEEELKYFTRSKLGSHSQLQ